MMLDRIEIFEALAHDGCALCWIVDRATRRHLRHILHEYVLDGTLRVQLHHARGFCPEHAWALQRVEQDIWDDGMGTATLYEDLARALARSIRHAAEQPASQRSWWRGLAQDAVEAALEPTGECPACTSVHRTERYLAQGLGHLLAADDEARSKFGASAGLCLRHFAIVLHACSDPAARALLIDVEAARLERIADELGDYILKHTVGHHDEPKGREQTSWIRVIEYFAGKHRS